jgi:hypothetical protein
MICLLLLWQREFYNLRALVCKLFWKELSFALKLEVFFFPFAEVFRSFVVVSSSSSSFSFQQRVRFFLFCKNLLRVIKVC